MNFWRVLRTLGPLDARNVLRDPLLRWMVLVPLLPAILLRYAWPLTARWLQSSYQFDLHNYDLLLVGFFLIFLPYFYGVLIGLLLLDERDSHTLTALRITPLSPGAYLGYRVLIPLVLTLGFTLLLLPLLPVALPPPGNRLLIALPALLQTPVFALFMGTSVSNKVAGLALYKALGTAFFLPMLIYFWKSPWHWSLAIFPSFWQLKLLQLQGQLPFWGVLGLALLLHGYLLWLLLLRFRRIRLD